MLRSHSSQSAHARGGSHPSSSGAPALDGAEILFVEDLATLLDRTPDAIRKALREGRLGAYGQLSGRMFVFRDRFIAYLRAQEVDPARAPTRGARRARPGAQVAS